MSTRSPYKVTHLCNHVQAYVHDCTTIQPLAKLRASACPRCLAIKVNAAEADLVVGTVKGGYFAEDTTGRALEGDDRVTYAVMGGESYLCLPRGYAYSVAIRDAAEQADRPARYRVVYQATS